jgi:hypothetical protein
MEDKAYNFDEDDLNDYRPSYKKDSTPEETEEVLEVGSVFNFFYFFIVLVLGVVFVWFVFFNIGSNDTGFISTGYDNSHQIIDSQSHEQYANQQQPTTVEFCNNTIIKYVDKSNNKEISGLMHYSINGLEFQDSVSKYQKYNDYLVWLENSSYYTVPLKFMPQCINEQDTTPNILYPDVFKKSELTIVLYDDDTYKLLQDGGTLNFYASTARLQIKRYDSINTAYMPFGGLLVIEHDPRLDVKCFGDMIDGSGFFNMHYISHVGGNTATVYNMIKDKGTSEIYSAHCQLTKLEGAVLQSKDVYVSVYPANAYITKDNKRLLVDVERTQDNDYGRVSTEQTEKHFVLGDK